jgi:homotetrameric cytidine deaminase
MENHSYQLNYISYASSAELNEEDAKLLVAAREAAHRAYAPYSKFSVGSAILLENGVIITGNNQENAAYPSGICAERVAMFYASSQYPGVKAIKVAVNPLFLNEAQFSLAEIYFKQRQFENAVKYYEMVVAHPDKKGNAEDFKKLKAAYDLALKHFNFP